MPRAALTADQRLLRGVNRRSLDTVEAALLDGGDPNRTVAVDEQGHFPTAGPRARRVPDPARSAVPAPVGIGGLQRPGLAHLDARSDVREIVPLLIWAIRKGTPAIVERLINAGADANAAEPMLGRSPLYEAAHRGQVRAVQALLAVGADVNAQDHRGETAFSWNHPKVRTVLIDAGFDLNLHGLDGRCPLHDAARAGDAQRIRWCLTHGALVNVLDEEGRTPLHLAATRSDTAILTALILGGADPHAPDREGKTPWDVAQRRDDPTVAQRFQAVLVAHEREVLRNTLVSSATVVHPSRRRL